MIAKNKGAKPNFKYGGDVPTYVTMNMQNHQKPESESYKKTDIAAHANV